MKTLTALMLLSTSVLAINAVPAADSGGQVVTKSTVVRFADLNLATQEGAQALYQRITRAAGRMCEEASDRFPNSQYRDCVKRAVDNAVAKVDQQTLYAVHQSKKTQPAG